MRPCRRSPRTTSHPAGRQRPDVACLRDRRTASRCPTRPPCRARRRATCRYHAAGRERQRDALQLGRVVEERELAARVTFITLPSLPEPTNTVPSGATTAPQSTGASVSATAVSAGPSRSRPCKSIDRLVASPSGSPRACPLPRSARRLRSPRRRRRTGRMQPAAAGTAVWTWTWGPRHAGVVSVLIEREGQGPGAADGALGGDVPFAERGRAERRHAAAPRSPSSTASTDAGRH